MSEFRQIREAVDQFIEMETRFQIDKMIALLSEKYNLDKNEIYGHLKEFETKLDEKTQAIQQTNSSEINEDKCLGKTKYNTQCSRSRQSDSLFCGSHLNKLPYGRVDDPDLEKNMNIKKRGRPRKDAVETN